MPADRNIIHDPRYPDYAYTTEVLTNIYREKTGKRKAATVLLGEWLKVDTPDGRLPSWGRVHVLFRGGDGYVNISNLSRKRQFEMFFIDVDQGDSILIQTPKDRRVLIDGGAGEDALEFIVNKYRLDKKGHYIDFDAVVATHSDLDHTGGLIKILRHSRIAVKRVYHNGLFRRRDPRADPGPVSGSRVFDIEDHPTVDAEPELTRLMKRFVSAVEKAKENLPKVIKRMEKQDPRSARVDLPPEGFVFKRLEREDAFLPLFGKNNPDLKIEVIWPNASRSHGRLSYPWYGDAAKTVNGNSIVLRIIHGRNRILLTGDLNESSMHDLLQYCSKTRSASRQLDVEVYKAAHHGSQHFLLDFLKAVAPNAAVVSSGDSRYDQHGHPRAVLMGTITRYSKLQTPAVFCTELAACYNKLPKEELQAFQDGSRQLYERAIKGIVHLRSDGENLLLATVHGRKPPLRSQQDQMMWKWDLWSQPH